MGLLRTIVIVGGGYSGTVLAANLLRNPPTGPTRILLIERRPEIGRGVAYAVRDFPYLLNVPAGRMSATSANPLEFLEFARRRDPGAGPEDFLPRQLYGDYLQELLLAAELSAPRHVRLDRLHGEVTAIYKVDRSAPLHVVLANDQRLIADEVVLACGNPPPANLPALNGLAGHPCYVADACLTSQRYEGTVLLIGTSLTMADVVMATADRPRLTIHALSRHGLVPPVQTAFRPDAFKGNGNALMLATASSLRSLVSATRILAEEAEQSGGDWREAVTFVRNMAPVIWQRLPERDRQRFLRHLRAYWDIHRHRLPPQTIRRIADLKRAARLHVHAGRLRQAAASATCIRVTWRPRGASDTREMDFDWVINCTGQTTTSNAPRIRCCAASCARVLRCQIR